MNSDIYTILDSLGIHYQEHKHPPVYTCEEADKYYKDIPGKRSKNLFLRERKGKDHFLVIIPSDKRLDLKNFARQIGETKLGMASEERLKKYLGVTPGSVTPFGLINDLEKKVKVYIDKELWESEHHHFHPCVNTSTLVVKHEDFEAFLKWCGNEYEVVEIEGAE